ncbi:MAG: hypothetical protein IPQ07_37270 [Myxococcales bacterium]|nr:hypothetical protein [Myxococcales bacterium]
MNPDVFSLGYLAADATYIYFSGRLRTDGPGGGNMVARVPLTGGFNPTFEILHTAPAGYLIGAGGYYAGGAFGVARSGFAVDAQNLYVIETDGASSDPNALGNVVQIPLSGGSPIPLATNEPGLLSVVVDATDVYWSALDGGALSDNTAPLKRTPIGGGVTTTVTPQSSGAFAVGPTAIVWSIPGEIEIVPKP